MIRSVRGKIVTDVKSKKMYVALSYDLGSYYRWLVFKKYWVRLHAPLHGIHVTLTNSKLKHTLDWDKAKSLHGKWITVDYDTDINIGGFTKKKFLNFYLKTTSKNIDEIKSFVGIVEDRGYKGSHITIGSTKGGIRDYWKIKEK